MNLQSVAIVVNETHLSEAVHEEADARTGGAYHLSEGLLTNLGRYGLGRAFFAEVSEQKEDARKSFFTGIEELIDEILFITNISSQQISHK